LRSEEIIRAISEFSANSICILNTAGKVIWVNDAVLKMTEYASEQVNSTEFYITSLHLNRLILLVPILRCLLTMNLTNNIISLPSYVRMEKIVSAKNT
jgi:PAS domain-containing protein